MKKCAVIGGGLGGLSAAIRLSLLGVQVDLYEKNNNLGGKANELHLDKFRFDTGPSMLTMQFVLESLFKEAGHNIHDYVTLIKPDNHCTYFFEDGVKIEAHHSVDEFSKEIENKTKDKKESIKKFLKYSKDIYDFTADLFLLNDFHELDTFKNNKNSFKTLLNISKIDSFRTVHKAVSSFFKDPKTVKIFDRYTTYNGSNPFKAPATLNIIPHVEYNMGSFLIKEGIYALVDACKKLATSSGVNLLCNRQVNSITTEKNKVSGIVVNGEKKDYDIVISNVDVNNTYKDLLNDKKSRSAKKYQKLEPSSSALVFFWAMKGTYPEFGIHNIIFSSDYKKEFNELFKERKYPEDPTIYIYSSSKFNRKDAPVGHENWFVMINAPYIHDKSEEQGVEDIKNIIINKINRTLGKDIRKCIIMESVARPSDIEKNTGSFRGSLYGISSNSKSAAFLRQANRSRKYKGLYFCGGSAHPGGGIPLVMLSGKIAADLVEKYEL